MGRENAVYINIPKEVHKAAEDYVKKHPELGYTGIPELVRDFLRDLIRGSASLQKQKPLEVHA